MNWGILSTAWIAGLVAPAFGEAEGADLVAVASRDQRLAHEFARRHGVPVAHGSYEALLADQTVEAVYIAVPNSLHGEWTAKALAANKHVLCEKPLTLTVADADALFGQAERRGRVLMEGFMYRHHPQIAALQHLIERGAIGEPLAVHCSFFTRAGDLSNIRYIRHLCGGALWDVGSYCVSLSTLLGGEPSRVSASAKIGDTGVDVSFSGLLDLANGSTGTFACGIEADLRTEVVVVGSDRTATISNPWLPDIPADIWHGPAPEPGVVIHHGTKVTNEPAPGRNPYTSEIENMGQAVRGERGLVVTAEETLRNLRTIAQLQMSAGLDRNGMGS